VTVLISVALSVFYCFAGVVIQQVIFALTQHFPAGLGLSRCHEKRPNRPRSSGYQTGTRRRVVYSEVYVVHCFLPDLFISFLFSVNRADCCEGTSNQRICSWTQLFLCCCLSCLHGSCFSSDGGIIKRCR